MIIILKYIKYDKTTIIMEHSEYISYINIPYHNFFSSMPQNKNIIFKIN